MTRRSPAHLLREVVLTLGAVLGVLFVVVAVAAALFGVRPLVVQSGSMSPAIQTGALAFARSVPATDLRVDDVVTVRTSTGSRVTHRIVDLATESGRAELRLKGDANETLDPQTYTVDSALRVFADAPLLGYVVAAMSSPIGLIALGAFGAFLIGVIVTAPRRRKPLGGRRKASAGVMAGAMVVGVAVGAQSTPVVYTQAAWTDGVAVTGPAFSAHTVARPDSVACNVSGSNATFSWPEKDPRYDYEIVLWRDTATDVLVSTAQVTGASVSRPYNKDNDFGLSGGLIGSNQTHFFYAQVRSWVAGTTSPNRWDSADVRQSTQRVRIDINCVIILLCSVGNPTCVA